MPTTLNLIIKNQIEVNLSYIPFIRECGLFIPTEENLNLGDLVTLNLQFPNQVEPTTYEGTVVWVTPKNSLYHVYAGVGLQFKSEYAKIISEQIKANLDDTMDVGGYIYGLTPEQVKPMPTKETS